MVQKVDQIQVDLFPCESAKKLEYSTYINNLIALSYVVNEKVFDSQKIQYVL